ncbi:MAG: hypothetical protein MUF34_20755 [Polyangiaceae bacterium]|nr:hypothetical protein [Polyangiaceae bacterium]
MRGVRGIGVILVGLLGAGSIATCSRPDERPIAAPGFAQGAGRSAGAGPAASASVTPTPVVIVLPESGPVASWADPRVIAGLAERCDFDPGALDPGERERRFGHALVEGETIRCAGPPAEPSSVYDPCRGELATPCENDCASSCSGCAANCVTSCGLCRGRCGGDEACVRGCAEATASCRQTCVDGRASCVSGGCVAAEAKCREQVTAEWVKSGCIDRVEATYLPCVAKCNSPHGACAQRCQAKVKACDVRVASSPQWEQLARLGKRWKKNKCDARCAAYGACAKECARGDRVCAEECREGAKPCDWTQCPEG